MICFLYAVSTSSVTLNITPISQANTQVLSCLKCCHGADIIVYQTVELYSSYMFMMSITILYKF